MKSELFKQCNSLYKSSNPSGMYGEVKLMCIHAAAKGEANIIFMLGHCRMPEIHAALEKLKQELPWELKGDTLYFYFTESK